MSELDTQTTMHTIYETLLILFLVALHLLTVVTPVKLLISGPQKACIPHLLGVTSLYIL